MQKLIDLWEKKQNVQYCVRGVVGEKKGCGMFVTHSLRDDRLKEVGLYFFI